MRAIEATVLAECHPLPPDVRTELKALLQERVRLRAELYIADHEGRHDMCAEAAMKDINRRITVLIEPYDRTGGN
jgi:hypothetical protein